MQGMEVFLSFLNLLLTLRITRELKTRSNLSESEEQKVLLNDVFKTPDDIKLAKFQIRVLSKGLMAYVLVYLIMVLVGDLVVYKNEDGFQCMHNMYYRPICNL